MKAAIEFAREGAEIGASYGFEIGFKTAMALIDRQVESLGDIDAQTILNNLGAMFEDAHSKFMADVKNKVKLDAMEITSEQ